MEAAPGVRRGERGTMVHSQCQHGLVDPEQRLARYNLALDELSPDDRRAWGVRVVNARDRRLGSFDGITFERGHRSVQPTGSVSSGATANQWRILLDAPAGSDGLSATGDDSAELTATSDRLLSSSHLPRQPLRQRGSFLLEPAHHEFH